MASTKPRRAKQARKAEEPRSSLYMVEVILKRLRPVSAQSDNPKIDCSLPSVVGTLN